VSRGIISPDEHHASGAGEQLLRLAGRGWRLFPCEARGKKPLIAKWPDQATSDPKRIGSWLYQSPDCNWAAVTGAESGFFVLDVDGEQGQQSLCSLAGGRELAGGQELIPETLRVKTGCGAHLYFLCPENVPIRNSAGTLGPGLDVRGEGGYVIVPPSVHPNGHVYRWLDEGKNTCLAPAPSWLLERLAPSPETKAKPQRGTSILDGQRNASLTSVAGTMRRRGMSNEAILAALLAENVSRCKPPLPDGEVTGIARSVSRYQPDQPGGSGLRLVCAAEVQPEDPRWCVEPFIPQGRLSLLVGDPGIGKTWVAEAIAADLTQGRKPFSRTTCDAANVLFLSNEDAPEDIRRRFDLLGGDPAKLFLEPADGATFLLANIGGFEELITRYGPVLVVVDTVASHFGADVDSHKTNEVASVLSPLAQLAQRHDVAILGLHHLTKGAAARSIYRVQGSIGFVASARSVLALGPDPENPERRILCHLKANSGPLGDSQTFTLANGIFRWTGKSSLRGDDVLAPDPTPEDKCKLDEAVEFLRETLSDGPRPSKEVQAEATQQGISLATVRRAMKKVGVEKRKEGYQGQWVLEIKGAHAAPETKT
jgi:hypothetical protein